MGDLNGICGLQKTSQDRQFVSNLAVCNHIHALLWGRRGHLLVGLAVGPENQRSCSPDMWSGRRHNQSRLRLRLAPASNIRVVRTKQLESSLASLRLSFSPVRALHAPKRR